MVCVRYLYINHYFHRHLKEEFLKSLEVEELDIKSQKVTNTNKEKQGSFDSIKKRPYHSMPALPPVSPTFVKLNLTKEKQRVDKYTVIEPDGLMYEKRRNDIVGPIKKLLIKKSTDYQVNYLFQISPLK